MMRLVTDTSLAGRALRCTPQMGFEFHRFSMAGKALARQLPRSKL
jgi:hypothetical protein